MTADPRRLEAVQHHLRRIQALLPPGEEPREYLGRLLDQEISAAGSGSAPMGVVPVPGAAPIRLLASARTAVEMIHDPARLADRPEGIVNLGTIEWLLRPALPMPGGVPSNMLAGPWQWLPLPELAASARSVCRLDLVLPGYDPLHVGTGFVAGEDDRGRLLLLTNAHVVNEAVRLGWTLQKSVRFGCDFERFLTEAGSILLDLDPDYRIHPVYDLAVVHLPRAGLPSPEPRCGPLSVSSAAPDPLVGFELGVIGHPSFDSRRDLFLSQFGFGDQYGVKRISPGLLRAVERRNWLGSETEVFLHDATTLSGSSGSCIVDLRSRRVVGIHFGGWPAVRQGVGLAGDVAAQLFHANGAVPLWRLAPDPFCAGVAFV